MEITKTSLSAILSMDDSSLKFKEYAQRNEMLARQVFDVYNDPVMRTAADVLEQLSGSDTLVLKARGDSIPNAVAVANILTENMMYGVLKLDGIHVDSDESDGRMISTIEIALAKKPVI